MSGWRPLRGVPRPPRDIEAEMEAAGAAGDETRLGIAKARYNAWLADQGFGGHTQLQLEATHPTEVDR